MKEMMFFDANCRIGRYYNGGPGAENAAALLREMDYFGVDKALVCNINLDKGPLATNKTLAAMLKENIRSFEGS